MIGIRTLKDTEVKCKQIITNSFFGNGALAPKAKKMKQKPLWEQRQRVKIIATSNQLSCQRESGNGRRSAPRKRNKWSSLFLSFFSKKSQTKFGLIAASFTDWYRFFCCPSTSSICQLINKFWLKFMKFIAIYSHFWWKQ